MFPHLGKMNLGPTVK